MTTTKSIAKVDFLQLIQDIERQNKVFPTYSPLKIADEFYSEQHQIAVVFNRFHRTIRDNGMTGLSEWRKKGYMQEDFDILFEYVERGYSQKIIGFDNLLKLLNAIHLLGMTSEDFSYSKKEEVECKVCEGSGYDAELDEECKRCDGSGEVTRTVNIHGNTEEEYLKVIGEIGKVYYALTEDDRIESFNLFIERFYEEDVNIQRSLEIYQYNEHEKPTVQFSGEDGNVFNLLSIAYRALERNGFKDKAKEMQDKIWQSHSYQEALAIMSYYVNIK